MSFFISLFETNTEEDILSFTRKQYRRQKTMRDVFIWDVMDVTWTLKDTCIYLSPKH